MTKIFAFLALFCLTFASRGADNQADPLPQPMQSGAPLQYEIWQWGGDAAVQKKLLDITNGATISGDQLPWSGVMFRFRVPVPHDSVSCVGRSRANFEKIAWGPEKVNPAQSAQSIYRLMRDSVIPVSGSYSMEIEAKNGGVSVAKSIIRFEIVRSMRAESEGLLGVGTTNRFPDSMQSGGKVEFQLWQWDNANAELQKELFKLEDGMKIQTSSLPTNGMFFRFRIPTPHDSVQCGAWSSDCFNKIGWGPEKTSRTEPFETRLYRMFPITYPFQVGAYCLQAEAFQEGKSVAKRVLRFEIIHNPTPPRNTSYLTGKKDCFGHDFTSSRAVELGELNETPTLKDNDYAFEPQHAYNVINWERFPPFNLPKRFVTVYNSRRFVDEDKFGGPLNRGFTTLAVIKCEQDNLPIRQRAWFYYPGQQVDFVNDWYKKNPEKYADLKAYADCRSAFVSPENAYELGRRIYESWGAGGYGPYDAGIHGWDEEEMWPTLGIGTKMVKEHPELVPKSLRDLLKKDPELKSPDSQGMINYEFTKAWGDFIGHGYRGARDSAAARGRTFKVWHYGSKAPGEPLFMWNAEDYQANPATGKYRCEEPDRLWDWFKVGNRVNFEGSEYVRQIDYFHKDFYYHTIFPHTASMYEKTSGGEYVLDEKGRRKIRKDVFEETVYADSVKLGYQDCETSPIFLKSFIAKGENALYWFNGAKYYKKHGTAITAKQLIPAMRPGNQETWQDTARFGSRPVSPYLAEAAAIYTFMMGLEGIYLWDCHLSTGPAGFGPREKPNETNTFGDIEFMVKGMHRVSQFNKLFEGDYSYIRPVCHYEFSNRDHPLIRGILNGDYLVLALTNPYLDPGESQKVELWYDAPYDQKGRTWSSAVVLQARKTQLMQCKLPKLPAGQNYDPDKLYLRYTCEDGKFKQTCIVTGNYNAKYPY